MKGNFTQRILIKVLALIFVLALATSCQWVEPPPDTLRTAHGTGAMVGCVRTMVTLKGETPNEQEQGEILNLCAAIAVDAVRIYDDSHGVTVPQSGPVRDLPPVSTL